MNNSRVVKRRQALARRLLRMFRKYLAGHHTRWMMEVKKQELEEAMRWRE